jgi:hypothetical protein
MKRCEGPTLITAPVLGLNVAEYVNSERVCDNLAI